MPDCFISYATEDLKLASVIKQTFELNSVSVFLAAKDLVPGMEWSLEIKNALSNSNYVIVLATKNSIKSHFVQQEFGGALFTKKDIILISYDIVPEQLPGWMKERQALCFTKEMSVNEIQNQINTIASRILENKKRARAILGLIGVGLFLFALND